MRAGLGGVTAAILAGGRGTRLQPVVSDRPKALALVLGRPCLAYLLDHLADSGIRKVVLLTGHMSDLIESTFGSSYAGMNLAYSTEPDPLGTGGALRHALPLFQPSPVLVLNGDSYWGIDLKALWQFHTDHQGEITVGATWVPDASRFGSIEIRGDRVERFREKQSLATPGWINAGVYLITRERIAEIPPGGPVSLERDVFPRWVRGRSCFAYCSSAPFLDIGTPESYAQAASFFESKRPAA